MKHIFNGHPNPNETLMNCTISGRPLTNKFYFILLFTCLFAFYKYDSHYNRKILSNKITLSLLLFSIFIFSSLFICLVLVLTPYKLLFYVFYRDFFPVYPKSLSKKI